MKCKACNGKGYFTGCIYESDEVGFVDKDYECAVCHGTGQIEQTNEEWFCQLPTGEKAKFLREMVYYGCLYDEWEQQSITENVPTEVIIAKWLKEKHE